MNAHTLLKRMTTAVFVFFTTSTFLWAALATDGSSQEKIKSATKPKTAVKRGKVVSIPNCGPLPVVPLPMGELFMDSTAIQLTSLIQIQRGGRWYVRIEVAPSDSTLPLSVATPGMFMGFSFPATLTPGKYVVPISQTLEKDARNTNGIAIHGYFGHAGVGSELRLEIEKQTPFGAVGRYEFHAQENTALFFPRCILRGYFR